MCARVRAHARKHTQNILRNWLMKLWRFGESQILRGDWHAGKGYSMVLMVSDQFLLAERGGGKGVSLSSLKAFS